MASFSSCRGEVISASIVAAVGAYIVFKATGWEYMNPSGPGPGFFPIWYRVAIVVLALMLLVSALRKRDSKVTRHENERGRIGQALLTWAAFVVCVVLLEWLGFVLAFALFTFFMAWGLFRRPAHVALIVAPALSLGFYSVFALLLKVDLPAGFLGI